MKNILLVPIQTDALFLAKDTLVTEASADFSNLPYFNGTRDVNADVANISENVISQPLQDQNLRLRKGLHLHWALPDALNRGRHLEDGKTEFPAVPNRWLVTRKLEGEEKSWVVESDYLYPEDKDLGKDDPRLKTRRESITVPVKISGRESGEQPFRYMGRKVEQANYNLDDSADRYKNLTTVGYGEPSFAAFYPNCHSVFGFHDPEIGENSNPATYDIIGWYSDGKQDFFKNLTTSKVVISKQAFDDNLTQYSKEEVEDFWFELLKFKMLDGRVTNESPAEQATVVLAPSTWQLPNKFEWTNGFLDAVKVLQNAVEQHIKERTGWAVQPVVSQADLDDFISEASEVTIEKLQAAGWLQAVPNQTGLFTVVSDADRPTKTPDFITDKNRLDFEKPILGMRLQRSAEQVVLHSRIVVNTDGYEGKPLEKKGPVISFDPETSEETVSIGNYQMAANNISVVIGNTGTEALSTYLANQLNISKFGGNAKSMEEQLESLYLLDKLDHRVLDLDAKFDEARHENGFNAVAGGHTWTITVNSRQNQQANAQQAAERPKLPAELAVLLNDINGLQWEYDRARLRLESLGTQLYADWYKYMMSTYPPEDTRTDYPDIDEVRYFIETKVMADIQKLDDETGLLVLAKQEEIQNGKQPASGTGGFTTATAKQLARKLNILYRNLESLNLENERLKPQSDVYMLQRTGGPRYYEPKEPVVLLANSNALNTILQPTKRHGQDGRQRKDGQLACYVIAMEDQGQAYLRTPAILKNTLQKINRLVNPDAADQIGYTEWFGQPWNPFRLDWEVELVPLAEGTNMEDRDYDADLVKQSFGLPINDPDLKPDKLKIASYQGRNPNIYMGKSLLTPQAKRNLNERLEVYLKENLIDPYSAQMNFPDNPLQLIIIFQRDIKAFLMTEKMIRNNEGVRMEAFNAITNPEFKVPENIETKKLFDAHVKEQILNPFFQEFPDHPASNPPSLAAEWLNIYQRWLEGKGELNSDKPIATALLAYSHLKNDNLHLLSQAFSGFNDAMLQLRQSYQLPIADPIGFKDYLPFTEQVARLAEHSSHLAPQPLTDFNPIRTGEMVINQLRLIDTFGQKVDIDLGKLDRVVGGEKVTEKKDSVIKVPLQPRLAQPARVNFRWLSAHEGAQEMNAVPVSSPICGWVMTNQLDDSLVIYDHEGRMLGSIEAEPDANDASLARWNTAPGVLRPVLPEAIENEFLQKMIAKIRSGGEDYVRQFIDGLDAVLRTIEPEEFESQQALSLLIGRPVALVRASVNLELQGIPAVDQGWHAFYQDREDGDFDRNRDQFTEVEFPVRLGKSEQFNDGLVGFWSENENEIPSTSLGNEFYLNLSGDQTQAHPQIRLLSDDEIPIRQSISAAPQLVSMLIDPRARVHVTTGILPVKEIDIPAEQYLPAMQQMAVTFLTAPLLSPTANVYSLLPTVEGYEWSWLEAKSKAKPPTHTVIEKTVFERSLIDGILAYLQEREWIQEVDEGFFLFLSDDQPLEGQFQQLDTDLFGILEEISTAHDLGEGETGQAFTQAKFAKKITKRREPVGKAWNLLVRSDVTWCRFVPDQPDLFEVLPAFERSSDDLPGLGLEELVKSILAKFKAEREIPSTIDPTSPTAHAQNWRELFVFPTIERKVFQQVLASGIFAYLLEHGWIELDGDTCLFLEDAPALDGQFQQLQDNLFEILDFISLAADGKNGFPFVRQEFIERLLARNEPSDRAWKMLLDAGWCNPIDDRPDTYEVVPLANRKMHELTGLGMEFLIESILQKHQQVLTEPGMDAKFSDAQMTIREGYLKLEKAEAPS